MKIERANNTRTGIIVPTRAEHVEAERRGVQLTTPLIRQLRAETRAGNPIKAAATANDDSARTITVLRRQVERLLRDNAALKLKLITGK